MLHDLEARLAKVFLSEAKPRSYMGCSSLGHPCDRKIWLSWKGVPEKQSCKTRRILARGHEVEERLIHHLYEAGYQVTDQQREVKAWDGQVKGHIDGLIRHEGQTFLLEIKSMNERSFKNVLKKGVKEAFPSYWVQMQLYGHLLKEEGEALQGGWLLALNKNDEELYTEEVSYEPGVALGALQRAQRLSLYETMPPRLATSRGEPERMCGFCGYQGLCWHEGSCL